MRLRKRDGSDCWYVEYYEHAADGSKRRVKRTTNTPDKKAAEALGRQWERDAADPDHARARSATLTGALEALLGQRRELVAQGERSQSTVDFYLSKAGHLLRVFADPKILGPELMLATLRPWHVDAYISQRRGEWADDKGTRHVTDHTITKELTTLRAALKLAKRRGLWKGDLDEVMPEASEISAGYAPRERWLPFNEALRLLRELLPDQAARVAFAIATSAEASALDRAERGDITADLTSVLVRGSKNVNRWRRVPVVSAWQRSLLEAVQKYAQGIGGKLFLPWTNLRRDLHAACRATGCRATGCLDAEDRPVAPCTRADCAAAAIAPCSPNDLRRTTAHWLKSHGAPNELVAPVMGHADTRMLERVYGKLDDAELHARLTAIVAPWTGTTVGQTPRTEADSADGSDGAQRANPPENARIVVPRDGIEPPTRGFSVPALLIPKPREIKALGRPRKLSGTTVGQRRTAPGAADAPLRTRPRGALPSPATRSKP